MKKYISIENYLKNEKELKSNKSKMLWYLLEIICFLIFIFSLYNILKWQIDNYKISKINKEIMKDINFTSLNMNSELVNPPQDKTSNYYDYINLLLYKIDFSKLLSQNKDTIGFIKIKNTIVNYPVVQTSNNSYYLNHSFDNKKNNAGSIFMDYRNKIDELDDNTIIYGHSRIDGTLFGSLRGVLTSKWQEEKDNYVIYFSTLKENMLFQIFSIYTINSENYYLTTAFNNDKEKQKWLDTMKKRNIAKIDTEVNTNDKFLTLSTCQNTKGGRIVIHAKLIKRGKNVY